MKSAPRLAFGLLVSLLLALVVCACGKAIGDTLDDATITTRVKTALLNDPDMNATQIDVETTAGVVTLSGVVRSKSEADRAVQVAERVPGVKSVRPALKITAQSGDVAKPSLPRESVLPAHLFHVTTP